MPHTFGGIKTYLFAVLLGDIFTAFAGYIIANLTLDWVALLFRHCLTLISWNLLALLSLDLVNICIFNQTNYILKSYFSFYSIINALLHYIHYFVRYVLESTFVLVHLGIVPLQLVHIPLLELFDSSVWEHYYNFALVSGSYEYNNEN